MGKLFFFTKKKCEVQKVQIKKGYSPEDERLEPENTGPLEEENHLPKLHFQGSMLIFGGVPVDVSRRPTNQTGESFMTTGTGASGMQMTYFFAIVGVGNPKKWKVQIRVAQNDRALIEQGDVLKQGI